MRRSVVALVALTFVAVSSMACTGNTEVQTDLKAISTAQDTAATVLLQSAMGTATSYAATSGAGYTGFNASAAAQIEPGIKWSDGAAAQNVVSIRGASATGLVLVTRAASGDPLCLAESAGAQSMGKQDAKTAAECTGGW